LLKLDFLLIELLHKLIKVIDVTAGMH